MSTREKKTYGLILKKKPNVGPMLPKPTIFGADDSSDEEESRKNVNSTLRKDSEKKKQMRQTEIEMNKVLEEDPTAYDYDNVYDEMAAKKASLLAAKRNESDKKQPKYISNLLKFAEKRKQEEERRIERQVQKEREAEGDEFADKDAFVTSAYRKKMQEMAEEEERQRRLDELEGDVTKQTDLSKFYRNLLDHNVSTGGAYDIESQRKDDEKIRRPSRGDERESNKDSVSSRRETLGDKEERRGKKVDTKSEGHERSEVREAHLDITSDKSERRRAQGEQYRSKKNKLGGEDERHRGGNKERQDKDDRYQSTDDRERSGRKDKKYENALASSANNEGRQGDTKGFDRRREVSKDDDGRLTGDDEGRGKKRGVDRDMLELSQEENENREHKGTKRDKVKGTSKDRNEQKSDLNMTGKGRERNIASKFARHSSAETVLSARERYLARKKARVVVQATSDDDEN